MLQYRLKNEYNVDIRMTTLPFEEIRWVEDATGLDLKTLDLTSDTKRVQDVHGNNLLLFCNSWSIRWALEHNKGLKLAEFGRSDFER